MEGQGKPDESDRGEKRDRDRMEDAPSKGKEKETDNTEKGPPKKRNKFRINSGQLFLTYPKVSNGVLYAEWMQHSPHTAQEYLDFAFYLSCRSRLINDA